MKPWIALLLTFAVISCRPHATDTKRVALRPPAMNPLALILAPHEGTNRLDEEIRRFQLALHSGKNIDLSLEQLGWAFVAKARQSFDPGYYKLAEQCALNLEARSPGTAEALLLRGHTLINLHQFNEAEQVAQTLVRRRGLPFDYGLLSDALMEQGRLAEAIEACQRMIDLRPDLNSYARAAHFRWLKGDLEGAIELMRLAVGAASPRLPEPAAWVHTRLAAYLFQNGEKLEAARACALAQEFQTDYAPALLLRGRMFLAEGDSHRAVEFLQRAVRLNPLPEYRWALAEALNAADRPSEAAEIEREICRTGAKSDPRTTALFLATRRESSERAIRLAEGELQSRKDVFSYDALAWAYAVGGDLVQAERCMQAAVAEGTQDARLFFHAAIIAERRGQRAPAGSWVAKASRFSHLLLPSEQKQLQAVVACLASDPNLATTVPTSAPLSTREPDGFSE